MTTNAHGGWNAEDAPTFREQRKAAVADAKKKADDIRLGRETGLTSRNIAAARAAVEDRPRPSLKAELYGRMADLVGPELRRHQRAHQRALNALTPNAADDPTAQLVAEMLARGRAGEAVDPDGEALAKVAEFQLLAPRAVTGRDRDGLDACAPARKECTRQTLAALDALVHDNHRPLLGAFRADTEDLVGEAEQVVEALDGATTAEEAITKGRAASDAWARRVELRERMIAVAGALHWVRRRVDRGFVYAAGRCDAWPPGPDDRHTSAKTWEIIDNTLAAIGASDAAVAVLTEEN